MEDKDLTAPVPHKWVPETDPVRCAVLLKLIEEAGELVSAASRCLMQGIDEREPVTGKLNREWLEDELADVYALASLVRDTERLNVIRMLERTKRKRAMKLAWLKLLGFKGAA